MGQNLDTLRTKQSKDELLHQLVINGNVEGIKARCREGAFLEWINQDGKTPLIVACMNPELYTVARTLIDLGANINAYRPGRHAGTPLHHAAKRGLDSTVKLLLSHGANALLRNDDCQTPLDVARSKGYNNVVRTIEDHISYFSGWLREIHGPGFLETLAPQLLSRKIWVVVIPCGSNNTAKPLKLELVIYASSQDCQPHTIIALWNAKIGEPKFHHSDPALKIFDKSTKTHYKFASASASDKQQIQSLYNACRGISQDLPSRMNQDAGASAANAAIQNEAEATELAMAISASLQSATENRPPILPNTHQSLGNTNGWGNSTGISTHNGWGSSSRPALSEASSNGWMDEPTREEYNGWGVPASGTSGSRARYTKTEGGTLDEPSREEYNGWGVPASGTSGNQAQYTKTKDRSPSISQKSNSSIPTSFSLGPSAPPIPEDDLDAGPAHYPSIDMSPVDASVPAIESCYSKPNDGDNRSSSSSSCVICWEAPAECACVPCGHVAGCMGCLTEVKAMKGVCPVCRAKIKQVIKLYAV